MSFRRVKRLGLLEIVNIVGEIFDTVPLGVPTTTYRLQVALVNQRSGNIVLFYKYIGCIFFNIVKELRKT